MPKKEAAPEKQSKKMALRRLDKTTVMMSDNPDLPLAEEMAASDKLPKGFKRIDQSTIIKA